jgi:hypothetical protein
MNYQLSALLQKETQVFEIIYFSELNEAQQAKHLVIRKSLESDDKLFHSALYNWYIEQGLVEELLHVNAG